MANLLWFGRRPEELELVPVASVRFGTSGVPLLLPLCEVVAVGSFVLSWRLCSAVETVAVRRTTVE